MSASRNWRRVSSTPLASPSRNTVSVTSTANSPGGNAGGGELLERRRATSGHLERMGGEIDRDAAADQAAAQPFGDVAHDMRHHRLADGDGELRVLEGAAEAVLA